MCTIWIKVWEIFGDPHKPTFPDDHVLDFLIPLDDVDNIPFDYNTLKEFEYDVELERLDDPKTSPITPT